MGYYGFIGHMVKLHEDGQLDDLEEISGSSAGALAAFMYIIGRNDMYKLIDESIKVELSKSMKINVTNFIKRFGFIKWDKPRSILCQVCHEFLQLSDVTFEQLYKHTGIKLHISAYSLKKQTCDYFSVDTSPTKSVIDSICMSMSVPLLFEPYNDYLDGGIVEDVPYLPFITRPIDDVYVIKLTTTKQQEYSGLFSYIMYILCTFYIIRHKCPIIYPSFNFEISNSEMFNFNMSQQDKEKIFMMGYKRYAF
jgi:predicted acylesterase/phospholipase RssA